MHVRGYEEEGFFFHEPLPDGVETLGFFFFLSRQRAGMRGPIFILKRDTRTLAHPNADFGRCGRYTWNIGPQLVKIFSGLTHDEVDESSLTPGS